MKTTNCESLADHFFTKQQFWNEFIIPISMFAGIFAYIQLSRNHKLTRIQWVYIFFIILGVYIFMIFLSKQMIPTKAYREFVERCNRCQSDPYCGNKQLSVEDVLNYTGKVDSMKENFESHEPQEQEQEEEKKQEQQTNISAEEVENFTMYASYEPENIPHQSQSQPQPYKQPNINPEPYDYSTNSIQILNSNPENESSFCQTGSILCSGDPTNQKKHLIAPVPGPQWQPQRASIVQDQLAAGQYTPALCPLI